MVQMPSLQFFYPRSPLHVTQVSSPLSPTSLRSCPFPLVFQFPVPLFSSPPALLRILKFIPVFPSVHLSSSFLPLQYYHTSFQPTLTTTARFPESVIVSFVNISKKHDGVQLGSENSKLQPSLTYAITKGGITNQNCPLHLRAVLNTALCAAPARGFCLLALRV